MTDKHNSNEEKAEQHIEKVVHNYHDYASEVEKGEESLGDLHQHVEEHTQSSNMSNGGEQNFPVKLHYMLNELEKDGMDDIVSWQPHGRCFLVHKQQQFVDHVLPLWFRQTKFPSFQRQLNLYGFKRLTSGRDKGGYYHELFLRSKRFLSYRIQRMKIKGTGARKPGSPETEPNFYNAPFLPSTNIPNKNAHVSMIGGTMAAPNKNAQVSMMASRPNMYPGTGGAMSLQQVLAFPTYGAPLQHHQAHFAPPPLFRGSASLLMEAQQAQLQQLHAVPFYPETRIDSGFEQHHIPMASGIGFGQHHIPQYDPSTAIALALSHIEQDQAALVRSRSLFMGALE